MKILQHIYLQWPENWYNVILDTLCVFWILSSTRSKYSHGKRVYRLFPVQTDIISIFPV